MTVAYFFLLLCGLCCLEVNANTLDNGEPPPDLHPPVVQTLYGPVRGMYLPQGMQAYLGIPFAKPPLKELRWQSTVEPTPWGPDVFDAFQFSPGCVQKCFDADIDILCPPTNDEDCLYLNIWAPRDANPSSNLPVVLFIPGGSYITWSGSAPVLDGRFIAEEYNFIFVNFNYRLGALGWMYTEGEDGLTGNYGLADQRAAMRFIQDNIRSFGGNPDMITLNGQSAGAQSIAFHLTNPETEPYFQQAILQSTPIGIPIANVTEAVKLSTLFSSFLNCSSADITCLRSKSAEEVIEAQLLSSAFPINIRNPILWFEQWGPVIDGVNIKKHPFKDIAAGNVQVKPLIIGETFVELPSYIYSLYPTPPPHIEVLAAFTVYFGRYTLPVLEKYWEYWSPDIRPLLAELMSDYLFVCPSRIIARSIESLFVHSEAPVYRYIFNHTFIDTNVWNYNATQKGHREICKPPYGNTCHDTDLFFTFYPALTLDGITYTKMERNLAINMQSYWANFIYTGDPNNIQRTAFGVPYISKSKNISSSFHKKMWPPYSEKTGWKSLFIEKPRAKSYREDFKKDKCDLFDKIGYIEPVGPLAPSLKECSTGNRTLK